MFIALLNEILINLNRCNFRRFQLAVHKTFHTFAYLVYENIITRWKIDRYVNISTFTHFLVRLQIGKLNLVGVRFERIFVSPYHVPIYFLIERSSDVTIDVKHVEDMDQMPGVGLKTLSEIDTFIWLFILYKIVLYIILYIVYVL